MNICNKFSYFILILALVISAFNATHILSSEIIAQVDTPMLPLRQPAEFEPMEGVLIRYPFGISYDLIAEIAEDVEVVTIVANDYWKNYVIAQYQDHGINLNHCNFLIAPSDSYWTRDYGPWFVFTGNNDLAVIDFTYNRPRPNDNQIPHEFALNYGYDYYFMNLEHTGGNYMTDGLGIAVSTDLVWEENPSLYPEEINDTMFDYLGIHTYHVVQDALGEYIKHINCWAKFLASDKMMIMEVPSSHPRYDEIEDAVSYFENQTSCYKTPYTIFRVYTPNGEPYVNSLILNNKVLVPITGSVWDDEALLSYQNAMPGYEVLGFTGSWLATDAINCRTKGIPDSHMLYIEHIPLRGSVEAHSNGYLIEAKIIPYSGENLTNTTVYWNIGGDKWNLLQMQSAKNSTYYAYISPQPNEREIYYYIYAEDASGRKINHPYIGAPQAHSFTSMVHTIFLNFSFSQGWNLITMPVQHNYTAETLGQAIPLCDTIVMWDVVNQSYIAHPVGTAVHDFVIQDGIGYFVHVTHNVTFSVAEYLIENISVAIQPGWNLLGWACPCNISAEMFGESVIASDTVMKWNVTTQDFIGHPMGTPIHNFNVAMGMGLFVHTTKESTWDGGKCGGVIAADANGPYTGLVGETIQFYASASGGTPPYTYHWDLGDGNTSYQRNPQHAYTMEENYIATLTVTDDNGENSSDTADVTIYLIPPEHGAKKVYVYINNTIPIPYEDAYVEIWNETTLYAFDYTNESGYCGFYLPPGNCTIKVLTEIGGDLFYTENFTIDIGETLINIVYYETVVHDVYIDTGYTGTYGTGIRIDNAITQQIPLDESLMTGKTYFIKYKVVNGGTAGPEDVNITVKVSNATWSAELANYTKNIDMYHLGNVTWDTTGLPPGIYNVTVNASIPSDIYPGDNERTRNVTVEFGFGLKQVYVYDNSTGIPVAMEGVYVNVSFDGSWLGNYTNASGFCEFVLSPRNYTLNVSMPGFIRFGENFSISAGEVLVNTIYLEAFESGIKQIWVYDNTTKLPMEGVGVYIYLIETHFDDDYINITNESGYCEFILPPGNYNLTALHPGYTLYREDFYIAPGETQVNIIYMKEEE